MVSVPPGQSEVMSTPGAKRSTQAPVLENDARWSVRSVAPAVSAPGTGAGGKLQALTPTLQAANANVTPSAITRATAASSVALRGPERLRLATAGRPAWWLATTQSRPAISPEVLPKPPQSSTRTGTRV